MRTHRAIATLAILAVAAPAAIGLRRSEPVVPAPTAPPVGVVESSAVERLVSAPPTAPAAVAPLVAYIDEPTTEQREMFDWAVARYVSVGLQLPDVEVHFPTSCGGKAGRYHVGQGKIELCHPSRRLVLHELAHAWDDSTDAIDRDAFLDVRDVDHWLEQPDAESEHVSGGEQLARVVTWGLMHVDITAPRSEYPGQPRDEQPRYLPGLADSSPKTLNDLFVMLTGSDPLGPDSTP